MMEQDIILQQLWGFVRGDIAATDFEQWVYGEPNVERHLGDDLYLATISTDFCDKNATWSIRDALARHARSRSTQACFCIRLQDLAVVDMGSFDAPEPAFESDREWSHDDVFASLDEVKTRGEPRWGLWAARCRACKQGWLVGADERHNDVYCMRRLSDGDVDAILQENLWPTDFDNYEDLLQIGRQAGKSVRFVDPEGDSSLCTSIADLATHRPGIAVSELSSFLNLDFRLATTLARRAIEQRGVDITFDGE